MVGHSLGAHLVGKAGRTYEKWTNEKIDRLTGEEEFFSQISSVTSCHFSITGLDPAGPRWVTGNLCDPIKYLANNVLRYISNLHKPCDLYEVFFSSEGALIAIVPSFCCC